jgi:hypothetical protein
MLDYVDYVTSWNFQGSTITIISKQFILRKNGDDNVPYFG